MAGNKYRDMVPPVPYKAPLQVLAHSMHYQELRDRNMVLVEHRLVHNK